MRYEYLFCKHYRHQRKRGYVGLNANLYSYCGKRIFKILLWKQLTLLIMVGFFYDSKVRV